MKANGSFLSEVYFGGDIYRFEAEFTQELWTAVIWNDAGDSLARISCQSHAVSATGDALEDAVCDWVHTVVETQGASFRHRLTHQRKCQPSAVLTDDAIRIPRFAMQQARNDAQLENAPAAPIWTNGQCDGEQTFWSAS